MRFGPEDQIQMAILDFLEEVLPNAIVLHIPNGGKRDTRTGQKMKLLGAMRGAPDLLLIPVGGKAHFIEVKAEKGRVSPEQSQFGQGRKHARRALGGRPINRRRPARPEGVEHQDERGAVMGLLKVNQNLTRPEDDQTYAQRSATYTGMAHFAGLVRRRRRLHRLRFLAA